MYIYVCMCVYNLERLCLLLRLVFLLGFRMLHFQSVQCLTSLEREFLHHCFLVGLSNLFVSLRFILHQFIQLRLARTRCFNVNSGLSIQDFLLSCFKGRSGLQKNPF